MIIPLPGRLPLNEPAEVAGSNRTSKKGNEEEMEDAWKELAPGETVEGPF